MTTLVVIQMQFCFSIVTISKLILGQCKCPPLMYSPIGPKVRFLKKKTIKYIFLYKKKVLKLLKAFERHLSPSS